MESNIVEEAYKVYRDAMASQGVTVARTLEHMPPEFQIAFGKAVEFVTGPKLEDGVVNSTNLDLFEFIESKESN